MISTLFKPSALKSKAYINIADSGLEEDSGIRLRLSPDSKANVPLKNDPEMVKGPELAKKQNDGFLKDAGGKSKANIHLDTEDYGYLTIETGVSLRPPTSCPGNFEELSFASKDPWKKHQYFQS